MGRGPPILCASPKLAIKQKSFQTENVHHSSCVCNPERGISRINQSCIIPTCPVKSQGGVIIRTGLVTAGQVAELLHTNVPETTGQLTPLCQA